MKSAHLHVDFSALPAEEEAEKFFSASGLDRVRFLISVNAGEPLKPLSRTASGGELSRIMLAFKTIAADSDDVGTLVFDEIDTGISGRMAQVVGEKMAAIGRRRQVICVTHLPQIAALGDSHHLVEKREEEGRTLSRACAPCTLKSACARSRAWSAARRRPPRPSPTRGKCSRWPPSSEIA